eukprot:827251-Ditylum_brightwellii.AAC.1
MDSLYGKANVVDFEDSAVGLCCVLPGISRRLDSDIVGNIFRNTHHIVIPDRSLWHTLGWDDISVERDFSDKDDFGQFEDSDNGNFTDYLVSGNCLPLKCVNNETME